MPRNPFPQTNTFSQVPSVDDMLSGAAWKDTPSCSIGGTGPYIPKMLLGRFDSEAERQARRRFYADKRREENRRNYATAVQLLREEGIISGHVAYELESKVQDEDGIASPTAVSDSSFHGADHPDSLCSNEDFMRYI